MARSLLLEGICAENPEAARAHVWLFDHATVVGEVGRWVMRTRKDAPGDSFIHARDDNLGWPIVEDDWRAAKLARLLNHFGLRFSGVPSAPELLDLSIMAETKAVELLTRLEGNPRRKDGKDSFNGRTVVDLAGYVLRRMFTEIEATLAKKSAIEREAFAVDLSKRLQALPDDVKERIRSEAGLADLSHRALMQTGAIAAVGGGLAGTVSLVGFAAYTTLTSTIAGMAGLVGLHLSFQTFILATSTLAFLSNPIVLGGALLFGGGLLFRRANRQIRDRLVPVMVTTATIAGVEVGGVKGDVTELAERLQRHAAARTGASEQAIRRIDATFPCLAKAPA